MIIILIKLIYKISNFIKIQDKKSYTLILLK